MRALFIEADLKKGKVTIAFNKNHKNTFDKFSMNFNVRSIKFREFIK